MKKGFALLSALLTGLNSTYSKAQRNVIQPQSRYFEVFFPQLDPIQQPMVSFQNCQTYYKMNVQISLSYVILKVNLLVIPTSLWSLLIEINFSVSCLFCFDSQESAVHQNERVQIIKKRIKVRTEFEKILASEIFLFLYVHSTNQFSSFHSFHLLHITIIAFFPDIRRRFSAIIGLHSLLHCCR